MSDTTTKPTTSPPDYHDNSHVCTDCRSLHYERGPRCAGCESSYQSEQRGLSRY